ncbi:MAG: hypothetical protein JKY65_24405 [Planctomycetes bacterium]|nr:hypothetical protein [Planctomycetota bacterium]
MTTNAPEAYDLTQLQFEGGRWHYTVQQSGESRSGCVEGTPALSLAIGRIEQELGGVVVGSRLWSTRR